MRITRAALATLMTTGVVATILVASGTSSASATGPVRIDSGSTSAVTVAGVSWLADRYAVGGSTSTRGTITGTESSKVYASARFGMSGYNVPVSNGTYDVTLLMAETYHNSKGKRRFDVKMEGATVLSDFDVFAAAGGKFRAVDRTFRVAVTGGNLDIDYAARADKAIVSAITIVPVVTPAPAQPAPAPTPEPTPSASPAPTPPLTTERPFSASSAWNTPLPAAPVLDPASPDMVRHLSSGTKPAVANLYTYGVPIWDADATTPRHDVTCVKPWGTCGLQKQPVPIPDDAFATKVSDDGAMVVIDWSTRTSYEFYEAQKTNGTWQAGWGSPVSIDGDGTKGSATGSNVSRLAGVVRTHEIAAGHIDHALVFSTNNACTSVFRYPATKTDGLSTRSDCIPEGARIRLDPAIDIDAIPGITPAEKTVARALQTYGAYNIDNGGANMAFIFEVPSGEADPYKAAGLAWDYYAMNTIPWNRISVLRQWDGR